MLNSRRPAYLLLESAANLTVVVAVCLLLTGLVTTNERQRQQWQAEYAELVQENHAYKKELAAIERRQAKAAAAEKKQTKKTEVKDERVENE